MTTLEELNNQLVVATILICVAIVGVIALIVVGIVCSRKKITKAPGLFFVGAIIALIAVYLLGCWKSDISMSINVQKWFYEDKGGKSITEFSEEFGDYCDEIVENAKGE